MFCLIVLACLTVHGANACAAMPPGEEKIVDFEIANVVVPIPFAIALNSSAAAIYPLISTSAPQALERIRVLASDSLQTVLAQELAARNLGSLATQLQSQLKTTVTYEPLQCEGFYKLDATIPATALTTAGYRCLLSNDNTITKVCTTCVATTPYLDMPDQYKRIRASVTVTNAYLGAWTSADWTRIGRELERQLRTSQYATSFATATVSTRS